MQRVLVAIFHFRIFNFASLVLFSVTFLRRFTPMALGIYISFRVLNTPDLTVDGGFVFGMTVAAVVTVGGHPIIGIILGTIAGALAGLITGILQTYLRINPILSGILTMTGLYTVNFAVLGVQSNLYLQSIGEDGIPVASSTIYKLFIANFPGSASALVLTTLIVALCAVILIMFFKTRPGMAVRATGDNEEMVRSSSINADHSRIMGIMISNALVSLSGALLCESQRYADLSSGNGMLVVGLASVIIGTALFSRFGITAGILSAILGSVLYRIIIQTAYQINMPSYMVRLLSAVIVVAALSMPRLHAKLRERTRTVRYNDDGA